MNWTREQVLAKGRALDGSWLPKSSVPVTEPELMQRTLESTDTLRLNKTERAFHGQLKRTYSGDWIGVQNVTLKIADDCRYTPDFVVFHTFNVPLVGPMNRTFAYEVKGFMRDDALVKLKVAARQFPWIEFRLVRRIKGEWTITTVRP